MNRGCLAVVFLGMASVTCAQDANDQAVVTGGALAAASGIGVGSTVKAAPALSFEGSRDDKIVRGQIGVQYRRLTFSVGAKTNVSSDPSTTTSLADLDGLRSKTT